MDLDVLISNSICEKSGCHFKKFSQDESNNDSQILETNRINSSEDSASDENVSEYSYDKKRKKTKVKKSVGRSEDPVNYKYIKLGVCDKNGHIAMKCKYYQEVTQRGQPTEQMPTHMDEAEQMSFYTDKVEQVYTYTDEAEQVSIYISEAEIGESSSSQSKKSNPIQSKTSSSKTAPN
ncbi:39437_t:CDS:2, partial [Gigaspora margarita]